MHKSLAYILGFVFGDYGSILRLNGKTAEACVIAPKPDASPFQSAYSLTRNTGQGVYCHGEPKGSKPGGEAKAILRNAARRVGGGLKGPLSHGGID